MAGIGMIGASGIDTTALIENLRAASSAPIKLLQQQARDARSASAQLSSLGSTLSTLRTAAAALDTANEVASFTVTQSNTNAFTTTSDGSAQPGTYAISVTQLAKEQRSYSKAFSVATAGTALGLSGTFSLAIGSGTAKELTVSATDTLETIASRINGLGLRVQASIFKEADGKFRMQLRGLDTGTASAVNFGVSGTAADGTTPLADPLGLAQTGVNPEDGKTVQSAQNAIMKIDGFNVERSTNQITGAVSGLTFALKDVTNASGTDTPVTLNVATDTGALVSKLQTFVSNFNTVVGSVNKLSGIGSTPAAVKSLSGDSTLRSILQDIRSTAQNSGPGESGGLYSAFRDVGVTIQKDGTLSVDNDKLTKAIVADPSSVQKLLARPISSSDGGVMAEMRETIDNITNFTSGKLQARKKYFDDKAKKADESAAKKNDQLDAYAERLRKAFTAMDDAYAKNQNLGQALSRMG
jgi:flagellar hook-associated protein 2